MVAYLLTDETRQGDFQMEMLIMCFPVPLAFGAAFLIMLLGDRR